MDYLEISSNRRFIQTSGGLPFFYLADTAWELFHRLTLGEIELYLDTRNNQGFNVIQAVLLPELDGLRVPNAYNQLPFQDMNPGKPSREYFDFIEKVLSLAGSRDIYFALVPAWGDKIDRLFGTGPEIFDRASAFKYGKWLGKRFRSIPNIIWMNGGDRTGGGKNFEIWDALGKGIKSEDPFHLMTFHPLGDASSSMWFHDSEWLDFNSCQSGHSMRNFPNHMMISYDYLRHPPKPCIDSEPRYEEHAVNWKPEENGVFDDYDIRQAAYWSVFSGACGHTYGTHPVWQMYDNNRVAVGYVRRTWKEALKLTGASQMIYLKNLMLSRPFFGRIPGQHLLVSPKVGDEHIRCTVSHEYALIYLPGGGEVEIMTDDLKWEEAAVWWYDPRTGESESLGSFRLKNKMRFSSRGKGRGKDIVLVLDDASARFGKPGEINQLLTH